MLENILNIMFSIPYLVIGFLFAIILDYFNKRKLSSRFTSFEIWSCIIAWPFIIIFILIAYFCVSDE